MKKCRFLAILLVLMLLVSGCGGMAATDSVGSAEIGKSTYEDAMAEPMATEAASLANGGTGSETKLPVNQKLVRKIWLEAETEDMDALLKSVEDRIAELGGYVEDRKMENGSIYASRRYRYGSMTVRIPADKLDSFVDQVSGASNIVSNRETTEDVTLSYVENESKVKALETEQTRLLELLAKAESMEDILKIENRLTKIREELETVKSKLRVYDNLVNYGTVYLNITEVQEFTVVEPEPETVWQRMGTGIVKSWKNMVKGLGNLLVFLVVALPYLLPIGIVATVVIVINKRKKKQKKQPPQAG